MYVVRRAFKNFGKAMVPGSVVEPGTIKHFKSRLRDHVIIEVAEQDFDKWNTYFITKFGVPIQRENVKTENEDVKTDEVKTDEVKTDEVKTDEVKTDEVKATTVKPVAKAVAKAVSK